MGRLAQLAVLVTMARRAKVTLIGLAFAILTYYLGHLITTMTLASVSDTVSEEYHDFTVEALTMATPCIDWPLLKPFFVKYHIANVIPLEGNELRAELRAYSIYRLRLATYHVYGNTQEGAYRCAHIDVGH